MSEATQHTDPLDAPLDNCGLDFSARLFNCLTEPRGGNFKTLREVCAQTRQELLRIPNFGKVTLTELTDTLAEHGLQLTEPPAKVRHTHLLQEVIEFPTVHSRLTRIEQMLADISRRVATLERMAGRPLREFPDVV